MKLRSIGLFVLAILFPVLLAVTLNFFPRSSPDITVENHNQARFAILPRFDNPGNFNNGLAPVQNNGQWGYVDPTGQWTLEPTFTAARQFNQGLAAVRSDTGWGFINRRGEWIIPTHFDGAKTFHDGRAAVQKQDKWGFVDTSGNKITPFRFQWVDNFQNGKAVVSTGKGTGFIDREGNFVVEPRYLDAHGFSEGLAAVKTDRGWGLIDRRGQIVIEPNFEWANSPRNGLIRAHTKDGWSVIRMAEEDTKVLEASFVSQPGPDGFIRFEDDGLVGFLDEELDRAIEARFDRALSFNGQFTPAKAQGLWGFIDRSGEWVIPPKFNAAGRFRENYAPVKVNDEWGYIPRPDVESPEVRAKTTSFRVDTGLKSVETNDLNESLTEQFPTWRYENRDRYVKVLETDYNHWEREQNVPVSNFEMPNAKYEVTRFPYREPTYLQLEAAEQFFWRTLKTVNTKNWFRARKGIRDGFNLDGQGGVDNHFFKEKHFLDDSVLVPGIPETLIYHKSDSGRPNLSGVMYYNNERTNGGPQIGGPLTVWHYHVFDKPICHEGVLVQPFDSTCAKGEKLDRSPEMIHTWFIDHPQGPFGTRTKLTKNLLGSYSIEYEP